MSYVNGDAGGYPPQQHMGNGDTPTNYYYKNGNGTSAAGRKPGRQRTLSDKDLKHIERERQKAERAEIVLWWRPFTTLHYCFWELVALSHEYGHKLLNHWKKAVIVLILTSLLASMYHIEGIHQPYVEIIRKNFLWSAYWVGLGILSSVGLGTGLHTFLLYLGPHIAAVTLAAYECGSTKFPEPPYPDDIICGDEMSQQHITLWHIMSKVRLEACMWGAGTAIGELPPYFMARAARLSGVNPEDDEEYEELDELIQHPQQHQHFLERAKIYVHNMVKKVGFFGILACASIPNPLFDLAGITCGHFLIPFWTFFGATLIGKALIKMHIQKLFVIFVFSEHHVENVVKMIRYIPYVGKSLQAPFKEWLVQQKSKLHHKPGSKHIRADGNWLGWIFEKVIIVMVIYFVVSIVNSMAQDYHKRLCKQQQHGLAPPPRAQYTSNRSSLRLQGGAAASGSGRTRNKRE